MTVKELIEELQKLPQDYKIYRYNGFGTSEEFTNINIYPKAEEVWL